MFGMEGRETESKINLYTELKVVCKGGKDRVKPSGGRSYQAEGTKNKCKNPMVGRSGMWEEQQGGQCGWNRMNKKETGRREG